MTQKPVYLDNSSTARPSNEVMSGMLPYYTEKWGVLAQPHAKGLELASPVKTAYLSLYQLLGASEQDTILFTSSAAEGVNHAFLSTYLDVSTTEGKNHFIITEVDEAPALMSARRMETFGCPVTSLKPDSAGIVTAKAVTEAITPRTALLAISWGNGLTGVVQPIAEIAEICKLRGVRLLVDATHVAGKLFFELKDLPVDFLVINGEQIHAPQGTGAFYIRQGLKLSPFIAGGIDQAGLRGCNLNVPGAIGLGIAAKQALEACDYMCTEVARLKMGFEKEVLRRIPQAVVLFESEERLPHISAIAFPGIANEAMLFSLHRQSVYASIGGGSQQQINYLLHACLVPNKLANAAISFSLSRETTEEELEHALSVIEAVYVKLRKTSGDIIGEHDA